MAAFAHVEGLIENKKQPLTCLYCGVTATTRDHTPSKNLLEKPFPTNLLTIPSCFKCNNSFSLDEEYFLNVLVEISNNSTLLSKKEEGGSVYKARQRSRAFQAKIESSLILCDDGRFYFKSENDRIKRVIEKNALGLYYHRYGKAPDSRHFVCTGFYPFSVTDLRPSEIFLLTYSEKFQPKRWIVIQKDVFSYIIARDWRRGNKLTMILHIHNSVWCVVEVPHPRSTMKQIRYKEIC